MTLGTRIVVMKDGVIQQVDTPQNLYDKPQNLFVAGFMGSPQMNFLDAVVEVSGDNASLKVAEKLFLCLLQRLRRLSKAVMPERQLHLVFVLKTYMIPQMFIETAKCTFESTIKVYELLGAEVYLYF